MASYHMTKEIQKEGNGSAYLEPGIYENITLKDVINEESKNGNKFLAFYFTDANGNIVVKTEWEPKGENLDSKVTNQLTRIKHIAVNSGIISEDDFVFKADTFEELAKQVVDKLKSKENEWSNYKLRVKVVYDDNGYTTLPRYVNFSWLESMSVPKEQSKIKVLPIDKMERTLPDVETLTGNTDPFADTDTSEPVKDDNEKPF